MATERQIAANRRNSARSTGPRSEAGKLVSRGNSTKHGMAGASAMVGPGPSDAFRERRAKWAAEYDPAGESGHWALDRAVAASLRIERCERAVEELIGASRGRAALAWDQDRAVEAAQVAGRLARDPVLASRQLETTAAGVGLLIDAWCGLHQALEAPEGWSDSDASRALDLLGIHADFRAGRTAIDGPEGADPVEFRKALALDEVDRLEELEARLAQLDEMDRRRAMAGDSALLSRPAKLLLRYERDAWRRYRESIREVRGAAPEPAPTPIPQASRRDTPSQPVHRPEPDLAEKAPALVEPANHPVAAPARSFEEERRTLLAEVEQVQSAFDDPSRALTPVDEDAWLDDLERRFDRLYSGPVSFVPIIVGHPASDR